MPRKRATSPPASTEQEPRPTLRLEWRDAVELADNPRNWRRHPEEQLAALEGAISEVGWAGACLYNERTGRLIDGHARRKVAAEQGAKVPVLVGSWDEATEAKILATLDPLAGMATADPVALDALLREVNTGCAELQQMLDDLWEDTQADAIADTEPGGDADAEPQTDRAEELAAKWGTKQGDLWLLGEHRLLCGDSTKPEDVARVMGGERADMIFMDPPYGHSNNDGDLIHNREKALGKPQTKSSAPRPIANDGPEANDVVRAAFRVSAELLKPGCCCCCCCGGGGGPDPQFARWSLWLDEAIPFKMCVVWDKGGLGMGWHYRRNWECVLVAEKPGAACHWFGGNDVPNIIRDIGKIIPSADDHPTPKPPELAAWFLKLHSEPVDVVVDLFAGGGSTLIACENLKRKFRGIEISPKYCAVILQRFADAFPGQEIRQA